MSEHLTSASEIVEMLGGTSAAARKLKKQPSAVSMWRKKNRLPPDTFLQIQQELRRMNKSAPPSLWRIVPADACD